MKKNERNMRHKGLGGEKYPDLIVAEPFKICFLCHIYFLMVKQSDTGKRLVGE